jgi:hypothetical protein
MRELLVLLFILGGMGLAYKNFRTFPWKEPPRRMRYVIYLLAHLLVGAALGILAGGWLAGRLP